MKLKIYTQNMWLLPMFASIDNKKRLNRLINVIKEHVPDLIALQEVWLTKYIKYLKKSLPDYFFCFNTGFILNKF